MRVADLERNYAELVDGMPPAWHEHGELDFEASSEDPNADADSPHRDFYSPVDMRGPAWATPAEIADDRGAPIDLVEQLVDDAVARGLLTAPAPLRVVLTPAGREHIEHASAM